MSGDSSKDKFSRRHGDPRPRESQTLRTPGQRDRDRILYTFAFRRMAGVTQVVRSKEGDFYHNRLTHSLKVAQIGRRMAEFIHRLKENGDIEEVGGVDPDVVEAASLAHDLGHPPFGHVAEDELDHLIREDEVTDGFEGNPQSFRIVTKIARRDTGHKGLNLTAATLNAILKYPWRRDTGGHRQDKWGYYHSESEDFEFAREHGRAQDDQQSAEAAIMDYADDLAYAIHDLEDFYKAGVIPLGQLLSGGSERDDLVDEFLEEENEKISDGFEPHTFLDALGEFPLANELKTPYTGSTQEKAAIDSLNSYLIKRFIGLTGQNPEDSFRLNPGAEADTSLIEFPQQAQDEVTFLKFIVMNYVFHNTNLAAQQYGHRQIIRNLYECLMEISKDQDRLAIIPRRFQNTIQELNEKDIEDEEEMRQRARVTSDIISSLTEKQTLNLHHSLTGDSPRTVISRVLE